MANTTLPIITLITELEDASWLAEALLFPEFVRYQSDEARAVASLKENLSRLLTETPPLYLHQRRIAEPLDSVERTEIVLQLAPPANDPTWRTPVRARFPLIRWRQGEAAAIAYVPALRIEIVTTHPPTFEALDQVVESQIRAELGRRGALAHLPRLVWLQRATEARLQTESVSLALPTAKQTAQKLETRVEKKKSVLREAATDLTKTALPIAYEADEMVARVAEALSGKTPRSVLLTGPSGVGKTAVLMELIRRRDKFHFGHTPFFGTNGSRLVAGMSGFGQWQERCQQLWTETARLRGILYLGNLIELVEVGKYIGNQQGIADFLRPFIARGDALVLAEATPEQVSAIDRVNPKLLEVFQQIRVEEPSAERRRGILRGYADADAAKKTRETIRPDALDRLDRLHQRYAGYSANPGRPVRFLRNLLADRKSDAPLGPDDVTDAFSQETGLPRLLLNEAERLDPAEVRNWFAARVIGQPDAVELIVDLLAMVKAGLTRPRKPIASLLFIGPTGVGKTEMAKSLAEFLFRDRERMARFDMSEYADPGAVSRLVGGVFGKEGLLTSRVREHPFSVVLLDELEKADPSFFDLLLQILGEGRLTDAMGRVADFSNAVVIMTSNLGAQSFQRGLVGFGEAPGTREAAARHFTNAVRQSMRPELFNRIDRIVPFAPLDEDTVLRIAQREIEKLRARDGIRNGQLPLRIDEAVVRHLARRGYDPRYGARPLKRALERELILPIATRLLTPTGLDPRLAQELHVGLKDGQPAVEIRQAKAKRRAAEGPLQYSAAALVNSILSYRRLSQALDRSAALRNLTNEIHSLERLEKRLQTNRWKNPADLASLWALPGLRQQQAAIEAYGARLREVEEQALLMLYGKTDDSALPGLREALAEFAAQWDRILIDLYALRFKNPDSITISVRGEDPERTFALAAGYYNYAIRYDPQPRLGRFLVREKPSTKKKKEGPASSLEIVRPEDRAKFLAAPRKDVAAILLETRFPGAFLKLDLEQGVHLFIHEKKSIRCLVETRNDPIEAWPAPPPILPPTATREKRRTYNEDLPMVDDHLLNRKMPRSAVAIAALLDDLLDASLMSRAISILE